jgi:glycerol kinase
MSVLAVDAGTTGVTALVVGEDGRVLARGYQEFPQHFPQPGWVEHTPEEIWQATLAACRTALAATADVPSCVGITNQRETAVLWDRETLGAPRRAIVWQDRRTAAICERLRAQGHQEWPAPTGRGVVARGECRPRGPQGDDHPAKAGRAYSVNELA